MYLKAQNKISKQVKWRPQVQVSQGLKRCGDFRTLENQMKSIPNESVLLDVLVFLNSINK
jgi:hypothetical protein